MIYKTKTQTCATLGRKQKYCRLTEKESWLPSLAELAEKKGKLYPYLEVFSLQLRETTFPQKFVQLPPFWTLPSDEAFLKGEVGIPSP